MKAVVLTFDRLPLHLLGCYGNLRSRTPNLDRLATESITFDLHFAEHVPAEASCLSWWDGRYAFPKRDHQIPVKTLPAVLTSAGVETHLFREFAATTSGLPVQDFSRSSIVGADDGTGEMPGFERLVNEACRRIETLDRQSQWLLWLQSAGIRTTAEHVISTQANAITALDEGIGRLRSAIDGLGRDEQFLFVVTAGQGGMPCYPAGASPHSTRVAEPIVHTPLIVRITPAENGSRRREFVQTVDLAPTLLEWFRLSLDLLPCDGRSLLPAVRHEAEAPRSYVCFGDGEGAGIRTEDFSVVLDHLNDAPTRHSPSPVTQGLHLYVKPEDPWEINDSLAQFPDQGAALIETLLRFVENGQRDSPIQIPNLIKG